MNSGVVVADDDPDILLLVGIAVRKAGLEVVASASDGDAALRAIRAHHPAVAILDNAMPGMTGLEIAREVRRDYSLADVTIVMLSASVDEAAQLIAVTAGVDHFRSKPFSPAEFAAFLAREGS